MWLAAVVSLARLCGGGGLLSRRSGLASAGGRPDDLREGERERERRRRRWRACTMSVARRGGFARTPTRPPGRGRAPAAHRPSSPSRRQQRAQKSRARPALMSRRRAHAARTQTLANSLARSRVRDRAVTRTAAAALFRSSRLSTTTQWLQERASLRKEMIQLLGNVQRPPRGVQFLRRRRRRRWRGEYKGRRRRWRSRRRRRRRRRRGGRGVERASGQCKVVAI